MKIKYWQNERKKQMNCNEGTKIMKEEKYLKVKENEARKEGSRKGEE